MASDKVPYFVKSMWIFNTLFHQSYAVISVFILWIILYNYKLDQDFTLHMFLSTVAYIPLMGEAIILLESNNVWSRKFDNKTKHLIHGFLSFVSGALATAGMAIMVQSKSKDHEVHFKSKHAWTGLVSWVFILVSQLLGLGAAYSQSLKSFIRPVFIRFVHNLLGLLGYIFGIVSLYYAIQMGSIKRRTSDEAILATSWILGITTAWISVGPLQSCYTQVKAMFA